MRRARRFGIVGIAVLLTAGLMVPALGVEPSELMVMDPFEAEFLYEPPWERVPEPPETGTVRNLV